MAAVQSSCVFCSVQFSRSVVSDSLFSVVFFLSPNSKLFILYYIEVSSINNVVVSGELQRDSVLRTQGCTLPIFSISLTSDCAFAS